MLYGPDGEPLALHENTETSLRGGWREGNPWDGTRAGPTHVYGVNRDVERHRSRTAWFTNPLFGAAVEIAEALLTGDEFSYATPGLDRAARTVLDEFWARNNLGELVTDRLVREYLIDGEQLAVFPQLADDPGPDVPAPIALVDVDSGLRLTSTVTDGVTSVTLPGEGGTSQTWETGRFVWQASGAMWNDPRGWPVARHAVDPSRAYMTLMGHRLNVHEIQGRIMAVQKVFVDKNDPNSRAAFREKAATYRNLPRRGGVLTMAMVEGSKEGQIISDSLEFTTPASGAANAEKDLRAFLRLVGLSFGLPEHYLGEGGNATRTTADAMTLPAARRIRKLQAAIRGFLDRLIRAELTRRLGEGRTYTQTTWDVKDDGKTRVKRVRKIPVSQVEVPWILPAITQDSLADLILRAEAAARNGWASPQTLSASLGFDPAEEEHRMGAVGLTFGVPNPQAANPTAPGGNANANLTPEPDADPPA
ncbi:hypothetical protein ACMT4L_17030 [Deinococcus sp. A31D244]|uniref:hypothetical protein n=1 Tax=Deinococcus sp. A31D244 TaxID=3397675 RepID=UPI0039DFD522